MVLVCAHVVLSLCFKSSKLLCGKYHGTLIILFDRFCGGGKDGSLYFLYGARGGGCHSNHLFGCALIFL